MFTQNYHLKENSPLTIWIPPYVNCFYVGFFHYFNQADLPVLEELVFVGNPLEEKETAEGTYRDNVAKKLPKLKKLDGICIILLFIEYIKNAQ